jgi:hypothetical protein
MCCVKRVVVIVGKRFFEFTQKKRESNFLLPPGSFFLPRDSPIALCIGRSQVLSFFFLIAPKQIS